MDTLHHDPDFEALLDYLRQSRGFDFTGYKRTSLTRRVKKRMQMVGSQDFGEYLTYLEVHPEEFSFLFNVILINVTSFFRDPPVWEYLTEEVVPLILAGKPDGMPIRAWSAGCASGEEAYSLAMVLAEALGMEAFRERVKIYATDVDEEALTEARMACFDEKDMETVPPSLAEKYFEKSGRQMVFHKDLRHAVIFGRHDLTRDAPISRVDLLTCRNTLMYFNAEAQSKILNRFHFALADTGVLLLGKAEMLLTHTDIFTPIDLKRRIFAKVAKGGGIERRPLVIQSTQQQTENVNNPIDTLSRIREVAFDTDPVAQIVVDIHGNIVIASERARTMFGLGNNDIGRPLQDLEISYRPVELRSRIEQVRDGRKTIHIEDVEWMPRNSEPRTLEVQLIPLLDEARKIIAIKIIFSDISHYKNLQQQLQQSKQDLETAYEELQSTNEELVTTNEELQSTNEELETTNEELQSTNEELETINEELQSASEELEAINEDLRERTSELDHTNAFLESILSGLRGGVVVVDQDLDIQIWNHKAEDLWGLRSDEVQGKSLLNLDIGLPLEQLRQIIRNCLGGESHTVTLRATNRRGREIECIITCTPLTRADKSVHGVILMMETAAAQHKHR